MPPKKEKDQKKNIKQAILPKDVLPPSIKQFPRDPKPIKIPEPHPPEKKIDYKPFQNPPEWPGDEQAKSFDFGLETNIKFNDPTKFQLPPSFSLSSSQITFWRRPKEFLLERLEIEENKELDDKTRRLSNTPNASNFNVTEKSKFRKLQTFAFESLAEPTSVEDDIKVVSPKKREQSSFPIKVFDIIDRIETEEEFEKRKKELEEKKISGKEKKKPVKKDETQMEEGPITVKDIKLSNLDLSGFYPYLSRWVASQLQIIKDRNIKDVFTDKPLYSKIYPQQDGLPIYNKSGRYWVKLYCMGKERKIEIDDKMPTNVKNICLFPRSSKKEEIWPMILTKALIKLASYNRETNQPDIEYGDGSVLYALTGLLPETLQIQKILIPDDWKFINELAKDYHYKNNTAFISCYSSPYYKPFAISNRVATEKEVVVSALLDKKQPRKDIRESPGHSKFDLNSSEEQEISPRNNNLRRNKTKSPTKIEPVQVKDAPLHVNTGRSMTTIIKERPTYVIPGFSYSIMESFYNENFNMVYVQKRSEYELKLRQEFYDLQKENTHKMNRDQKLESRKKKKEYKEKIHEEEKKRLELIAKLPIQYKFFRVKTAVSRVPVLNIQNSFTPEEIYLAKKCILNNFTKPPCYDLPEIKVDDKSVYSQQVSASQVGDTSQIIRPLEDFSSFPNIVEPMKKGIGGVWIMDKDFNTCFEYIQIFYNIPKLIHHKQVFFPANTDQELTFNDNAEVLIIDENLEGNYENNSLFSGNKLPLIITFSAQKASNTIIQPTPYCVVQKYDFLNFEPIKNYKTLNQNIDSLHLLLENKNHAFRIMVNSPLGYSIWVSCYNQFKLMSMGEYLTKIENYVNKTLICEYSAIEKEKYHVFLKYKISGLDSDCKVFVKIKNFTDGYIIRYLRFKLIDLQEFEKQHDLKEGIHTIIGEKTFNLLDSNVFCLKKHSPYLLILESKAPIYISEGNIEFEFFSKQAINIDPLELNEPVEYSDKYNINKYGILFRERLFVQDDVYATFFLRIANIIKEANSPTKEIKGKKQIEINDNIESEILDKRLIIFELFQNDVLLTWNTGSNFVSIPNIILHSTKEEKHNYYLQAKFDLREWENCNILTEETKNITWFLKVFSNETIAIVKDTQKEDNEKAIKKSWEDKEPGRAEKGKKNRQKYLLLLKKEQGLPLTEQELEIINEPRLSKKQREDEIKLASLPKGKSPVKAQDKKNQGKQIGIKKDEIQEEKKEKNWPESNNHLMKEIQNFLIHLEKPRLVEEKPWHGGLIDTRSKENKEEIKETYLMFKEDLISQIRRNNEIKENWKNLQIEIKKKFQIQFETDKKNYFEKNNKLLLERDDIKKKQRECRETEKKIEDFCNQAKPNYDEFEKVMNTPKPDIDKELIKIAQKALNNAKIFSIIDKLTLAISTFDMNTIEKILKEITDLSINPGAISTGDDDVDLINQANLLLEEKKNNPNFEAEKQAELKKAGNKKPVQAKK